MQFTEPHKVVPSVSASSPRPLHILYLDPSDYERTLVRHALQDEHEGFHLTEAASWQAFEACLHEEHTYDLVLADLDHLGDAEPAAGLATLQARLPDLPIVLLTASEDVPTRPPGVVDTVVKTPQHLQRLPYTVAAAVEQRRLQRERQGVEAKLKARIRQQAVVVELGQRALSGTDLQTLLQEATARVAQSLGLELCHLLEYRHDRQTLFLRAGVGWNPGLVGQTTLRLDPGQQACFPFSSARPVILENLTEKPCHSTPPLLQDHGVVSGMSVLVPGEEGPYGVLGVYSRQPESFAQDDLHFLQAVANVLATAIDRTRAEDRLRTSEERYRTLVESARDVIYTVDLEGRITSLNPAFAHHTGFTVEEWIGRPFLPLIHPEDARRARRAFEEVRRGRRPRPYELRIRKKGGGYLVVEFTTQPDVQEGRLVGSFGIARDITDRKQAEAELIAAKERAEEMSRLKTAFLTNISHEIRTPLTSIIGFASILTSEVNEEHREFVHLIEQSGQRLLSTLNSILDLSMLESGALKLNRRPVNVTEEVAEKIACHQPQARKKGLRLVFASEPQEIVAHLDRACLDRILNHLIGNAIKFTEQGEVHVSVRGLEDRLEIHIRDTGVGIEASFLPHLFDAFKQESMGIDRPFEGSGLGLAITKKLVTLLHGEIRVESSKGQGSTFIVSFPVASTRLAPTPEDLPPEAAPARRPRVLAIEDNPDMLVLVERFLGERYEVVTAEDEEQALARAREQVFDVVLMDINLGRARTGVEVLAELRQVPGYARVPVIAVTAYALPGDREHFLHTGFDGYLGKPFTRRILEDTIAQVLAA